MAKKSSSKKKSSTSVKRKRKSSSSCSCTTINRETGGSPAKWTQCRKNGKFVRMAQPKAKGITCDTYKNKGKTYRRCYKSTHNKLTGRHNWVPVRMNKTCER